AAGAASPEEIPQPLEAELCLGFGRSTGTGSAGSLRVEGFVHLLCIVLGRRRSAAVAIGSRLERAVIRRQRIRDGVIGGSEVRAFARVRHSRRFGAVGNSALQRDG